MLPDKILHSSLIDIVFDGRNKEYGAYTLRKGYNQRLCYAMGSALAVACLITLFHFMNSGNNNLPVITITIPADTLSLVLIDPEKPKVEDVKPIEQPKPVASIKHSTPVISAEASDTMATIDDLLKEDAVISTRTQLGEPPVEIAPPVQPESPGTGTADIVQPPKAPEILESAEYMPEFPGGKQALYRFLSRNLRVPEEKLQPGERVKIIVKFFIDLNGKVNGIQFSQGGEPVFEREVMRVMKKMPNWNPGMQQGKPVQVYYSIPVIFEVPE